jgi:hypothetical protein
VGVTGTIKYRGLSAQRLIDSFEQAAIDVLNMAKPDAKKILNQIVGKRYASLAQLAKDGHPYARSHANVRYTATLRNKVNKTYFASMPAPPAIINKQTGVFAGSFVLEDPKVKHGAMVVEIQSNDGELDNILKQGTPTMVNRPWDTLFGAMMRDQVINRMRNEYRRAVKIRLVLSR